MKHAHTPGYIAVEGRSECHLQICQGVLHGGSASEGYHDSVVAPAHQAPRILLGLPEALRLSHPVQTESGVQTQCGAGCEGCALQLVSLSSTLGICLLTWGGRGLLPAVQLVLLSRGGLAGTSPGAALRPLQEEVSQ